MLKLLDGKKTKTAALIALAVSLNEVLKAFGFPHLSDMQAQAVLALAGALGLYGMRKAIENLEAK